MKILIVGGAGGFGSFYAKLLSKNGFEIGINDSSTETAKNLCEKNSFEYVKDYSAAKNYDSIIISVPNSSSAEVIRIVSKEMKKDSLLINFWSVKTLVEKELNKISKTGLEVVSIHPLHGPRVDSITGYPIAWIPFREGKKSAEIKSFFEKNKAKIIRTTCEDHDKIMSIVQGLTHYSQFVSAATLKEAEINLSETMKFSTPNYALFLSLISRIVIQNPELYAQIQLSNPYNAKIRKIFSEKAKKLEALCKKNSAENLKKEIIQSGQSLKKDELLLLEGDRAVNSLKYTTNLLETSLGKYFLIENILTHTFHYGIVNSIQGEELILLERKNKTKIAIQKIRLTTEKEMQEWKETNLVKHRLDFSLLIPKSSNPKVITEAIKKLIEMPCELVDIYESEKLPEGTKSLTLKITFYDSDEKNEVDKKVKALIPQLGWKLR